MSDDRTEHARLPTFLKRFALSGFAGIAAFLVAISVAWACGNATVVSERGLFPIMIYVFGGACVISLVLGFFDRRRDEPMNKWRRVWVGAAIVVMLTATWTVYYGITVDSEKWRIWDKTEFVPMSELQDDVEITFE